MNAVADEVSNAADTSSADPALRKRRLRWQCRRGMRELDLMLLDFVECHYDQLSPADQARFEQLLQNQDQLLLAWLMGHQQPAEPQLAGLIAKVRGTRPASDVAADSVLRRMDLRRKAEV